MMTANKPLLHPSDFHAKHRLCPLLLAFVLFLGAMFRNGSCCQEERTAASVRTELLKSVAITESRFHRVRGNGLWTRTQDRTGKVKSSERATRKIAFAIDNESYKLSFLNPETHGLSVHCATPRTSFTLSQILMTSLTRLQALVILIPMLRFSSYLSDSCMLLLP